MEKTLLNLIPGACSPEVHLSQYDKGRAIPFKLAEGKSAYSVPDGSEIVVQATKPSGLGFVVPVTFDGDTATMTITETMSNEYGRFPAELSITKNGNKIGTANFVMNIERSPHPEGTTDGDAETIIPELTLLVERIEAAADSVDEDTQIVTEAKAEVLQAKADTLQAKADTLTARDDALQAKADAITAKESAEASAQAAEEASERAEELIGSVSTKADAIVKTASGEIASFTDGGDDLPMKSLKVNIEPKQSGSGDPSPSNVRPISGVDTVIISNSPFDSSYPNPISGKNIFMGNAFDTITPCRIEYGQDFVASASASCGIRWYDANMNQLDYWSSLPNTSADGRKYRTYTMSHQGGCYYFKFYGSGNPTDFMVELGSTPSAYEPYGEHTDISLGQTVYGGTLEVMSGKLTIEKVAVDLGSLNWGYNPPSGHELFNTLAPLSGAKLPTTPTADNILCSSYVPVRYGDAYNHTKAFSICLHTNGYIYIYDSRYTDATALKTALNGVYLVYELETPIEITLTPTEVKTLLGNNNIWSDSGSVEVEYRADTTLVYNELLSLIASLS